MTFDSARRWVDRVVEGTAIALFILMGGLVVAQVVARKLFDPLVWSEELARYVFIWVALLGWAIASRRGSHVAVTVISDRLSPHLRAAFGLVIEGATIAFAALMVRYGLKLVENNWDVDTVTLFFTAALIYAAVPVTALLLIVTALFNVGRHWRALRGEAPVP